MPPDAHLIFSMPGYYPTRVNRPLALGELGTIGSRLVCWEYDVEMAKNLAQVLECARGALNMGDKQSYLFDALDHPSGEVQPLVRLQPEDDNAHDPDALLVLFNVAGREFRVGRLPRRDAAGLTPMLRQGAVKCVTVLQCIFEQEKSPEAQEKADVAAAAREEERKAAGTAEGTAKIKLPRALKGSRWYVEVVVYDAGDVKAAARAELDLASVLRCNLGISRLREVLRTTGPWPIADRRCLVSMSASVGQEAEGLKHLRTFVSACEDTEDINAWGHGKLLEALLEVDLKERGEPRPRPLKETRDYRRDLADGTGEFKTAELLEILRPRYQPGSNGKGTHLLSMVLPTGHAPGALMSNLKAFKAFEKAHEATGGRLLHNLDIDTHIGVHRRISHEQQHSFARRCVHTHGKFVVALFRSPEGESSGWAYIGSHNMSATAWGQPSSLAVGDDERLGLVQHSSWECGMLLTVPRSTSDAEARMGFDAWPLPFDPLGLHPYGRAELQEAHDQFAAAPALAAKQQGHNNWQELIPPDVRRRRDDRQLELDLQAIAQSMSLAGAWVGSGGDVYSGDDEGEEDWQLQEAMRASIEDQSAAEEAAYTAACQASKAQEDARQGCVAKRKHMDLEELEEAMKRSLA